MIINLPSNIKLIQSIATLQQSLYGSIITINIYAKFGAEPLAEIRRESANDFIFPK